MTRLEGRALGTTWHVTVVGEPVDVALIDQALAIVDRQMSTWRDDSELMAVRQGDGPVPVSPETALVVGESLALAATTGGAFDPTVEPLLELWGFRGAPPAQWPSDEALATARAQVGWQRVQVGQGSVDAGGAALDLSAIAKGFAVDQVSAALTEAGATRHLVEVGGEVVARGTRADGNPWTLGIEAPLVDGVPGGQLVGTVALTDAAMATSGNYRSRHQIDGRWVAHTMDPRTGLPFDSEVLSATVVGEDCMHADGWATALMVLGPEGLALVEAQEGIEALLLVRDGEGWTTRASSGMSWSPR